MTRRCTSAEARREHQHPAHEPSSHREAQTDVARSTSCFAVSLSLSGCPFCLWTAWGLWDRSTIDQPTRAPPSVPDHAKGTVVLPLGAQQAVSQIAKKQKASHIIRSNSRCLASAQHILSHACLPACLHRVILICAYHRSPLLAYSSNPRYRYNETCPSKSHPRDEACCRADPPRSPGSER